MESDGIIQGLKWLFLTAYYRTIPHKQAIWCKHIDDAVPDSVPLPDNIQIKRCSSISDLDDSELRALTERTTDLMGSAGSILINKRFRKGGILWLLKENEQTAGYRWTFINDHINPTYVPHGKNDVHSIALELLDGFRKRGLYRLFLDAIYARYKREGIQRCYSEVYLRNKEALNAMLSTGASRIGTATRFNFFGKNVVIWHDMNARFETFAARSPGAGQNHIAPENNTHK